MPVWFSDRGGARAVFRFGPRERAGDAGGRPHEWPPVRRLQRTAPRPRPRHLIPGGQNLARFAQSAALAVAVRFSESEPALWHDL